MIKSFGNAGSEDIFHGSNTKAARKLLPRSLHRTAQRKLDMINAAVRIDDLRAPPGNRLEKLVGNLSGRWSIRINDQFRITFVWKDGDAYDVTICDYH